jgi:flagellar biosynthesis/type III secretory pathway M-ring protein FliF/YscJ
MTLIDLLKQVIVSWQVLAVTVAIVIYFFIVSYAARSRRRSRVAKKSKPKKVKAAPMEAVAGPEMTESDGNHVDDLGIEEA